MYKIFHKLYFVHHVNLSLQDNILETIYAFESLKFFFMILKFLVQNFGSFENF